MKIKIYPSLISADLLNLGQVIKQLDSHCEGYHVDVMDNHFVPNLTFGADFVNAFGSITKLPLHVHLMVDDPSRLIEKCNLRSQDLFIFHYEAVHSLQEAADVISLVSKKNARVGIALNPQTSIDVIIECITSLDHVLVMSVEPGSSGQRFISSTVDKVTALIELKKQKGYRFDVGIDGGVGKENIKMLAGLGIDHFAMASALFSSSNDPVSEIESIRTLVET
jgi:ribulose-phosphate 3-epimerase